jgi:hypothetical protein
MKAILCITFFLLSLPAPVYACEPLVPLAILFGVPFYSLFGVIILKAGMFAWLEKSLKIYRAALFMVAANIFSSLIGFLLTIASSAPTIIIVVLPIVFLISITPSKRFITFNPWGILKQWNPKLLALLVTGLYFLTFVLFGLSQTFIDSSLTLYWLVKFCYVITALVISIGLTTLWEEWIISKLSKSDKSYLMSVLKVNLMAFFIIMAVLAAIAFPERLRSRDFLI